MVLQLGSSLYTQELISHSNLVRLVGTKLPSSLSSTPIGDIEGKVSCAEFAKLFRSAGGITWASTCNFSQKLREVIDKLLLDDTTKFARAEAQWEDVLHEWTQELFKKLMVWLVSNDFGMPRYLIEIYRSKNLRLQAGTLKSAVCLTSLTGILV